ERRPPAAHAAGRYGPRPTALRATAGAVRVPDRRPRGGLVLVQHRPLRRAAGVRLPVPHRALAGAHAALGALPLPLPGSQPRCAADELALRPERGRASLSRQRPRLGAVGDDTALSVAALAAPPSPPLARVAGDRARGRAADAILSEHRLGAVRAALLERLCGVSVRVARRRRLSVRRP